MIYFIEHDAGENICHVCADPNATIVPLINRVTFNDVNGNPLKDASGNDLSSYALVLNPPTGITQDQFNTLMTDGIGNYTWDATNSVLVKRTVPQTQ